MHSSAAPSSGASSASTAAAPSLAEQVVEASATINAVGHHIEKKYRCISTARAHAAVLLGLSSVSAFAAGRLYYVVRHAPLRHTWRIREAHRRVPQYTAAYQVFGVLSTFGFLWLFSPIGPLHRMKTLEEHIDALNELGMRAMVCRQLQQQLLSASETCTRSSPLRSPAATPLRRLCIPNWTTALLPLGKDQGTSARQPDEEAALPSDPPSAQPAFTSLHPSEVKVVGVVTFPLAPSVSARPDVSGGPMTALWIDPREAREGEQSNRALERPRWLRQEWECFTRSLWSDAVQRPLETLLPRGSVVFS